MTDKKVHNSESYSISDEESKLFRDAIGDAKPIPKIKNTRIDNTFTCPSPNKEPK